MTTITFKGKPVRTAGDLPRPGSKAPDFHLVRQDLSEASLATYKGKKKILNIFPSIDTSVCALSVRTFQVKASKLPGVVVLNISADLPFAQKRFCGSEGLANAETLSSFRSSFGQDYGVVIQEGPLQGLMSRAVLVVDEKDQVVYAQQVPEIAEEPNYQAALEVLGVKSGS
ncbi:MAG: thiol peroxidase [Planctomycetota bacterium]|nr:MAG: thiol peroxidase [Planctomycetota bacterium]